MQSICVNSEQLKMLIDLITIDDALVTIMKRGNEFTISMGDGLAANLSEQIKDNLVMTGFDKNYKLNNDGLALQNLLDKFISIGW